MRQAGVATGNPGLLSGRARILAQTSAWLLPTSTRGPRMTKDLHSHVRADFC